jgi:hypothetical protein
MRKVDFLDSEGGHYLQDLVQALLRLDADAVGCAAPDLGEGLDACIAAAG